MNRLLLSLLIIVYGNAKSFSQNCDPATVGQLPGNWKEGLRTGSAGYAEAAVIAKAKKITEAFHNSIKSEYTPYGLQASYFYSRIEKEYHLKLYNFSYSIGFHPFYCDKNAVKPQFEGDGGLRMTVNPGIFFKGGGLDFMSEKDKMHYGWVDKIPTQKNGVWDFGEIDKVDGNVIRITDYKAHLWLITYDGKLPYQYVSRLEFLQKKKTGVQREKQKAIADIKERSPVRPKAEQEKEKEEQLKKIKEEAAKGYGDWTKTYLRNYQTDEQIQEEAIRKTSEYYDEQLRVIEQNLRIPEKELQQPAIMIEFQHFKGFAKEGETGARILVKENPDYYNKKLPGSATQLIMVSVGYDALSPVLTKAAKDLMKAIDFSMLKNLPGK